MVNLVAKSCRSHNLISHSCRPDGSGDWKSYHLQFTHTGLRFEWTYAQKLDNALLCLRGKTLKFFSTRSHSVQQDFKLMMENMLQRFGNKDIPFNQEAASGRKSECRRVNRRIGRESARNCYRWVQRSH